MPPSSSARNRLLFALLIVITCVGCDQTTKHIAQTNLPIFHVFSYLGDTIRLQHVRNTGAAFSIGSTLPESTRFWIFIVGQGIFLLFLAVYLMRSHREHRSQFYGFALILGGGLGNFYDRLFRDGAVVDFLNIGFGNVLRTAVFNVADVAITIGLVLLVFGIFRPAHSESRARPDPDSEAPAEST